MVGNNNPFNIRSTSRSKWLGQTGYRKGFCEFDTLEHGIRVAAYLIIRSYFRVNVKSYRKIIQRFAPPSENDTKAYLKFVTSFINVQDEEEPVDIQDFVKLLRAMSIFEGNPVASIEIEAVIKKWKYTLFQNRLMEIKYSPKDF